jgi:hypothetical protein
MKRSLATILLSFVLLVTGSGVALAQDKDSKTIGAVLPECDPSNTNLGDGGGSTSGCGKDDFIQLLINVIKFAEKIIVPIAIAIVAYQAFIIVTSTGNAEKVSNATKMIGIAVTGVVILLLSHLIIQIIFNALGVQEEFAPGGINITDTL